MIWKIVSLFGVALSVQGETSDAVSEQKVIIRHLEQNGGSLTHIGKKLEHHEEYAKTYPSYEFSYKISDPDTKDVKGQQETREGDKVDGLYWLLQPNGYKRTVNYVADNGHGFKAKVRYDIQRGNKHADSNNNKYQNNNNNGVNENNNCRIKQQEVRQEKNVNAPIDIRNQNTMNDENKAEKVELRVNEKFGQNNKGINSNGSENEKEIINNSEEKNSPKTEYSTEDLNDEGSSEEKVWIPNRNNYVSTKSYSSYEGSESNENNNKANTKNMKEQISSQNKLLDTENTSNPQIYLDKNWNIYKLEISNNNKNKFIEQNEGSKHYSQIQNLGNAKEDNNKEDYGKERHILKNSAKNQGRNNLNKSGVENYRSEQNNNHKSNHRFVKTEHKNKIYNIKENSDIKGYINEGFPGNIALDNDEDQLRNTNKDISNEKGLYQTNVFREENENLDSLNRLSKNNNHIHQKGFKNSRSREENDHKSRNKSRKLENDHKILNTKQKSRIQLNESSRRGIAADNGGNKSKLNIISYRSKAESESTILKNSDESKVRVLNDNRNKENYSAERGLQQTNNIKEKERYDYHKRSSVNNNGNKNIEHNQNDGNISEEIFEHHIVVHHPTLNHIYKKRNP